ncbi:MAG TPA: glycine cleavage system aminomethyltransferase GcvT [Candidatus Limnocylindria bacterium]|nr:glycine cleavage system aminomethyltransferase GcvT [Candidatus Limnocylindria bacterium]
MATEAPTMRRTPLYDRHAELGAKMVPFAGYEMPIQYEGIVAEHRAVRGRAGLFDLSHMGEFFFKGRGAGATLDRLISSDIAGLAVGQARYGLLTNERGTIVDDVIVYRISEGEYMVVVNAANIAKDRAHVLARLGEDVAFDDRSYGTALVAIQGPRAVEILASTTDADVRTLPAFGVTHGRVAGSRATIARTGYTGEDGFEVFVANAEADKVWDALLGAGREAGMKPIGLGARDTLRLEARFSLYGNDIDETTDPIEAGLGWTCKLDKEFTGRDVIAAKKAAGPTRKIAGLVIQGGVGRHGHEVAHDGEVVGQITSGTYGPTVEKNIALAYVPTPLSKIGTALAVRIRGKDVPATVVKTPFYSRGTK